MLRDNLAGLIAPMCDSAEARRLAAHAKPGQTGGYSKSTDLAIVAYKRSWSQIFQWKRAATRSSRKSHGFRMTTETSCSRAVWTPQDTSDNRPSCLENPRPEGAESTLTGYFASPFPAEPRHIDWS